MRKLIFLWIALGLSACVSVVMPTPLPTSPPTLSPSLTATVEWFPATETPTLFPVEITTPIPQISPNLGEIIFSEDFSSAHGWTVEDTNRGSINVKNYEINLIINEPKAFLYSVSEEAQFTDFYVEIIARPSLCSGKDEYGLMFRATKNITYYRYSLSCDGEVRLDRIIGGVAFSPQSWLPSASVPSAAPSESRLGVWAVGDEFHFFINGEKQFTITDNQITKGSFGVFARSAGENAVTVSFTDLLVHEIE